jgi:hypothetical protein
MCKLLTYSMAIVVVLSAGAMAQITVANNFQPPPGSTFLSFSDSTIDSIFYASMTAGTGGPMQWDFSNRNFGSAFDLLIVSTASTPSIDSFPNGNLVIREITGAADTGWAVYRSDAGVFTLLGSVSHIPGLTSVRVYRNIVPDWIFPISFNSQWTSSRHLTQRFPASRTETYDTTTNIANAWGNVVYHANSIPCLRVMQHARYTYVSYDTSGHLLYSYNSEDFTTNFIGAGFTFLVTLTNTPEPTGNIYGGTASGDFLGRTGVVNETPNLPIDFTVAQNYPNPFNARTTIQYDLPTSADVKLEIFDILGRRIDVLAQGEQEAGNHSVVWDGENRGSGIYLYRIQAGNLSETKKMQLLK